MEYIKKMVFYAAERYKSSLSSQFCTVLNILISGKLCMVFPKMAFVSKWEQNQVIASVSELVMKQHVAFCALKKKNVCALVE